MDALYILGTGSAWENRELRFSLRSLQEHVRGIDRVFVVGENPGFLSSEVWFYPCPDPSKNKEFNIASKVAFAFANTPISDDVLFINDDHVFLASVDAPTYPYYWKANLEECFKEGGNRYQLSLKNTYLHLQTNGYPTRHYDVHTPIIYNRQRFLGLSSVWEKSRKSPGDNGFVVKSTYSNTVGVTPGPRIRDLKLVRPKDTADVARLVAGRHVFSFSDSSLVWGVGNYLHRTYPARSRYESAQ